MNFINEEVIQKLMKSENNSNKIAVLDGEIKKDVVGEGNNFCSEVSQLTITYRQNGETLKKLFFLKIPSNIALYEKIASTGIYLKEVRMYESILPRFRTLLPEECFAPEHYYTGDKETLILEDLSQSGYEMRNKYEQLDFEHSATALRQLAKFHAVSVRVDQTTPEILDFVREDKVYGANTMMTEMRSVFEKKAEIVLNRERLFDATESSDRFRKQILPSALDEIKMKPDSFNVLIHGDLHIGNIMYKYDAYGHVENVRFIDLQLCRWTSPAVDILYFFTNSVRFEIFEKYFDLLLKIYVDVLNKVLKYLKCDCVYKIDDLYNDIESKYNSWIFTLVFSTPLILCDVEKGRPNVFDLSLLEEDRYVQLSKKWLLYFKGKGVFSKKLDDTAIAVDTFLTQFQQQNEVVVTKHEIENDVIKAGDNYCSGILRLKIEYEIGGQTARKSVLLKIPSLSANYEQIRRTEIYDREIFVYRAVLPRMYDLRRRPRDDDIFAPVFYAATESKALVLEDLGALGFRNVDKKLQLDLDHCRIALRTLAEFHALSTKYLRTPDGEDACARLQGMQFDLEEATVDFFLRMYDSFVEETSTLVSAAVHERLKGKKNSLWETAIFGLKPNERGLNVIVHGDYWTNNILFQYDGEGRARKSKMIDFQASRVGSPALDLIYFFVSSVRLEVYEVYGEGLLNFYVDTFNDILASLNCDCTYTRDDLNKDLDTYKELYFNIIGITMRVILLDEARFFDVSLTSTSQSYLTFALKWLNYLERQKIL